MDLTLADKRGSGPRGGTHGALTRYFELLEHGDLHEGHVTAFKQAQSAVRNRLAAFKNNGCNPPDVPHAQSMMMAMEWIANRPVPTSEDVKSFRLAQAISGGGIPVLSFNSGIATVHFGLWQPSLFILG